MRHVSSRCLRILVLKNGLKPHDIGATLTLITSKVSNFLPFISNKKHFIGRNVRDETCAATNVLHTDLESIFMGMKLCKCIMINDILGCSDPHSWKKIV